MTNVPEGRTRALRRAGDVAPATVSRRAVADRLELVDELLGGVRSLPLGGVETIRVAVGAWLATRPELTRP